MKWQSSAAGAAIPASEFPRARVRISDRPDPWLLSLVAILATLGMIFVFDTSWFVSSYSFGDGYRMTIKHGISAAIGAVLLFICSRCPSDFLERKAYWIFGLSVPVLLLTLVPGVGECANGACRWMPFGFFNLQPAEFTKVGFVIVVAAYLTRMSDRLRNPLYGIAPVLGTVGVLGLILLSQPDFGTAALLGVIAVLMLFLSGVPVWQLVAPGAAMVAAAAYLVISEPYRFKRLTVFLNPDADPQGVGWQLRQALIAFGSGQVTGQGLGASTQKTGWLPEAHTDFIFSVIGEETGLIGAVVIVALFALVAWRGFRIAHRHSEPFAQLLAAALTLVITLQAMINMGVVLGLLPTKGIGLPFISYGGSSMMVFLAAAGILLSLSRELRER
ncbi:MAG TPA: putative lipid II flippase FtsW [Candidatus Binatia bacterium]|nr:putative lipid II flippase FtsW [Candidatus Binatia bacterium]